MLLKQCAVLADDGTLDGGNVFPGGTLAFTWLFDRMRQVKGETRGQEDFLPTGRWLVARLEYGD